MVNILISILLFFVGLSLGFYLLLFGRKALAVTTAIVCLAFTGELLAIVLLGEDSGWALVESENWVFVGIAVAAGIVGGVLGLRARHTASNVVGFVAGGYIALWLYNIAFYLMVSIGEWPEQTAFWVGVFILIIGGLIGLVLTRRDEGIAIIIVSVFVGTDMIITVLNLNPQSSFTAVFAISLALLGLVVQYAQYLREVKAERPIFTNETADRPAPELFDLTDDAKI